MARTSSLTGRSLAALIAAGAVFVSLPITALAADLRQGSSVTVGADQTISDDLYAAGGTITVAGTVNGSVIAAGGTITISGNVSRDLMVAGGTVNVTGKVGGNIRAAGGNLTLNGPVAQDIVITGGTISIGSSGSIGRDLVVAGGTATVAAPVARRIMMASGTLTLQNKVGGDVTGRVDHLKLDGAQIGGNLDYTSNNQVDIANGARVAGTTTRHTPPDRGTSGATNGFIGWLRALIGIFALGLLLILLLPRFSIRSIDVLRAEPWLSLGIGAVILVATPIVALIAFIVGLLIGGWWLGLLLIPAWILTLAVGYVVSSFLLGRLVFAQLGWGGYHDILALLGGLVILAVVTLVPVIGWLVGLAAVVFGAGALALTVARRTRAGAAAA
jgi:cytoskeletal protein CcmA (bactofilin family)